MPSRIEWLAGGETWNPLVGCSPVSAGCDHCYAARMAARHLSPSWQDDDGDWLALHGRCGPRWTGRVRLLPERLSQPLHWRQPRRIFVSSMGDLFHPGVTDEYIAAVYGVMAACPQHEFIVLTKRPKRALKWYRWVNRVAAPWALCRAYMLHYVVPPRDDYGPQTATPWPLPHVTLGVSVEDQPTAYQRLPLLLQIPAARHIVSVEPMLGPVDLPLRCRGCGYTPRDRAELMDHRLCTSPDPPISAVICGAETGPGARPMDLTWARSLRDQCAEASIPFFFTRDSTGSREMDGRRWEEWAR
ncbi:MAG: DUF5131 family protein [Candidatus Eisenbacteria bacterium]